jgi:hypothetical protein
VSIDSLALVVTHDGQGWDALLWPDCQPQKCRGGWPCALCTQIAPYSHVFRHLSDLLFENLAQPLLDYLNRLPEKAELRLSAFQDGGATWAKVDADAGTATGGACAVMSWPIGGTATRGALVAGCLCIVFSAVFENADPSTVSTTYTYFGGDQRVGVDVSVEMMGSRRFLGYPRNLRELRAINHFPQQIEC